MTLTPEEEKIKRAYLGDGLYAEFDGWQFKLYTDRYDLMTGDTRHEVYLDRYVLASFLAFVKGEEP